ncbi:hypothetical protein SRHO_G00246610 [Serrasalmus rhombeus]
MCCCLWCCTGVGYRAQFQARCTRLNCLLPPFTRRRHLCLQESSYTKINKSYKEKVPHSHSHIVRSQSTVSIRGVNPPRPSKQDPSMAKCHDVLLPMVLYGRWLPGPVPGPLHTAKLLAATVHSTKAPVSSGIQLHQDQQILQRESAP